LYYECRYVDHVSDWSDAVRNSMDMSEVERHGQQSSNVHPLSVPTYAQQQQTAVQRHSKPDNHLPPPTAPPTFR